MAEISFNINFDDELYSKFEKEYTAGNFSGAIKTSILYLTECIRDRTDLDLDGDKLITKAFSVKSPLIKFNNLNTTSEMDEQVGNMMILQGLYKGIRNPRNHNLKSDNRFSCDSILILINYYVKKIKKARLYFDYHEFLNSINDKHFDRSTEYSDEVIKSVPQNKLLDTNIALIKNINQHNYKNISYIILSSIKKLEKKELNKFYEHCSKILQKTKDYSLIKALLFALKDTWQKIERVARIRIESLLIKSLENLYFDEFQATDDYNNYYTEHEINEDGLLSAYLRYIPLPLTKKIPITHIHNIIKTKLEKGSYYVGYILKSFHVFLFKDHEYLKSYYNETVIKLLEDGNQTIYKELTSGSVDDEDFNPYYNYDHVVKNAIIEYERVKNNDKMEDNIPF